MHDILLFLAPWATILAQLCVAVVCGGLIGFERESVDRPAGFRTHVLVCVGSAVYMLVSIAVSGDYYDPGRIAAQVASGIGFLGAGTIIKQGSVVKGLTTAASLWAVAGIGLAAGYGKSATGIALLGTLVVYLSLRSLKSLERCLERCHQYSVSLTLEDPRNQLDWVQQLLTEHNLDVRSLIIHDNAEGSGELAISGRVDHQRHLEEALKALAQRKDVESLQWDFH